MKDLRNEYLRKDEEKLMNAIHENHKDALMDYQINSQLKAIARKESERKEKRTKRLMAIVLVIATIGIIFLGAKYNEKQVKNCMEAGHDETFCRYDGE